jgi:DNA-directed RNA polymerase subunit alpha
MNTVTCIETYIDSEDRHYGCFLIEPLETGQGITLGNSLRRTLLSDLTSFSIVGARINNLKHEFTTIEGLREDVLEVLLNLKEIVFKNSFAFSKETHLSKLKAFLNVKGPTIVTAGMLNLPKDMIKVINPHQYIATVVDNSELYLEVDIEKGKGYRLTDQKNRKENEAKLSNVQSATLAVDAIFMPVKKVNYKIKLIHDSQGNIKESLTLEIWTNGSISPKRCLQESIKILMNLFYPLLISPNFLNISSEFTKRFVEKENERINKII